MGKKKKKKDPNEVLFNADLRYNERCRARDLKKFKDNEVVKRVVNEYRDLNEKIIRLDHFIYRDVENGKVVKTERFNALSKAHGRLLVDQLRRMTQYGIILEKRLNLFRKEAE